MPKTLLVAFVVFTFFLLAFGKERTVDPRLHTVKTIFISGNNKQALEARKKMQQSGACFTLTSKPVDADAVLEVKEAQEDGILHTRGASAELTLKSGEMIWSDYRMAGGERVMWQLIHDACR